MNKKFNKQQNTKIKKAMKFLNAKEMMNTMNNKKEIKYKSELLEKIRQDFKTMERESKDIDLGFFTEDDVFSFFDFLLMRHCNEWTVIDDTKEENKDGGQGNEGTV